MSKLKLVLVTHAAKLLDLECDSVTLPGSEGFLGILPGHTPLISTLRPGLLSYTRGGSTDSIVLSAGFCEISDDIVTVLADSAEMAEAIDVAAARELKAEAEAEIAEAEIADAYGDALKAAQTKLALAEARIELGKG